LGITPEASRKIGLDRAAMSVLRVADAVFVSDGNGAPFELKIIRP
jgi:hypothetical protein